jgi:hypothetical protein
MINRWHALVRLSRYAVATGAVLIAVSWVALLPSQGAFSGWQVLKLVGIMMHSIVLFALLEPAQRTSRARARASAGLCTGCGYNLTGNTSGVCLECGTAI